MKYRTIVADPPWLYGVMSGTGYSWMRGRPSGSKHYLAYPEMPIADITALPVGSKADTDAHLYLWTTQRFLEPSYEVVRAWGFTPVCVLVWCKAPHGFNPGGVFGSTIEFVHFARRGRPKALRREQRQWFEWSRTRHSSKPEAFLDMVESVSPGPYLELFARRNRLGWDTWGDECLEHIEVAT